MFGTVPPSFSQLPRDVEVTANGRIVVECVADGNPTPVITWKINNTDFHGQSARSLPQLIIIIIIIIIQ